MSDSEGASIGVVPHNKSPHADIFGMGGGGTFSVWIVRPDLGYYLSPQDSIEKPYILDCLHPALQGGEHYFGTEHYLGRSRIRHFYIIEGDRYRKTSSLSKSKYEDFQEGELHTNCRGGDHYTAHMFSDVCTIFTIVFEKQGMYRVVSDLSTAAAATKGAKKEFKLHDSYKNGLYYWATSAYDGKSYQPTFFIAKKASKWVEYIKTGSLDKEGELRNFPLEAINFLPGGVSLTMGKCSMVWEPVLFIEKDDNVKKEQDGTVRWTYSVTKKVGYNKSLSKTIEKHWDVSGDWKIEVPIKDIFTTQLSLTAAYGGSNVTTSKEDWKTPLKIKLKLKFHLELSCFCGSPSTTLEMKPYSVPLNTDGGKRLPQKILPSAKRLTWHIDTNIE